MRILVFVSVLAILLSIAVLIIVLIKAGKNDSSAKIDKENKHSS